MEFTAGQTEDLKNIEVLKDKFKVFLLDNGWERFDKASALFIFDGRYQETFMMSYKNKNHFLFFMGDKDGIVYLFLQCGNKFVFINFNLHTSHYRPFTDKNIRNIINHLFYDFYDYQDEGWWANK